MPAPGAAEIPAFRVSREADRASTVVLTGQWTLQGLAHRTGQLVEALKPYARDPSVHWDLTQVGALDSVGAGVVWRVHDRLAQIEAQPAHLALLQRWADGRLAQLAQAPPTRPPFDPLGALARALQGGVAHFLSLVSLLGQLVLDFGYLLRHPERTPWREVSATIYDAGVRALGVTAIVGFLIGIVISYLGALSLSGFGAETFIVNILGIGIIRELGPLLTAILVAGRSGSSITAQIGVMRVTQELDALAAMGTSQTLRLVLPRVIGLMIAVPLLVVWTDAVALLGGMLAASANLGVELARLYQGLPDVVPSVNLWFGIVKGGVFGAAIGIIACDYGLRTRPDSESLGQETTNSVVTTITVVILADAVAAVVFQSVGLQ